MVNDGSIKFKAYSEEKYRLEDKVRVSIPNGDFTQTKYIIGKSVKEDEIIQPISYVSEIDSVLSLEEDLSINNKEFGIKANGGDMGFVPIWEIDISRLTDSIARSSICDTFYIQADFRCMLNSYNIKSGSYGLKVEFYIPVVGTGGYIIKTAYMDSKDMFGNPYAFTIFSTQEKKFHLSTIAPQISAIKVYFYQSDDFTYKKNGVISRLESGEFNNIFVRNIITGFGSEIANIEDNSLQIYTKQTMYYDNTSAVNNQKDISIAWYNKDENNKYLGFSDGVYDPEYDEMEYLDKATAISRLMSRVNQNVPNDYPGLSLAADIEDINKSVSNVNKIIKFDLVSALRDYSIKLKDILSNKDIENHFDNMIMTAQSNYEKIQEYLTKLQNEYYSWLKKAVQYLNGEEVEDLPVFPDVNAPEDMTDEITTSETLESYQQIINSSLTLTQEELKYFALIEPTYGVDSLITTVANNYPAYLGICQKYRAKIEKIYNQIQEVLDNFLKLISNNEDEKAEGTNIDQLLAYFKDGYKFIDIKEFLKDEDDLTQYDNKYCLYWYHYNPDKINEDKYAFMDLGWERIGGRNQGLPAEDENNEGYYVKDDESVIDSLSVGLDLFKPEEKYALVLFYNHEQINSNILTFTNNTEEASDEDIALQGEISIINDQYSLDHYPYYGVDNLLIASERSYERQIKIKYEGTYYNQDEVLPGALIKWYIPAYSSMILPVELNNSWVKVEDEAGYYCYQKTIEVDNDNKVKEEDLTFKYKIDINYSPNFINNTIKCKITQNDIKLEAEKSFTFGNEGSSGTQYELRITPVDEQNFKGKELKLDISLFNGYEEVPIYTENTSGLETELGLYAWGAELSIIPTQNDFKVEKIALSNERETLTGCRITKTDTKDYCGILQVNVNIGEEDRIITLTQYYPIGYNKIKDLAFEGASSIVYDNLGANPSFISRPYRLYQNGEQVSVNKWYMVYYTQNSDDYVRNDLSKEEFEFYKKYMPTLANNILAPSNLYIDNIDCYATVEAVDKNNELLWAQNIFIMQNRYPSTFINKWDGDFEINEENGTIMGTMFGAGRKNEKNQFEGVLMGDVATGAQSSFGHKVGNGIGLYGFNQGAQSFAFLNDGTGFIGKSGAGRILFDGNNSFIASSNWFSSGGRILENGEIGGSSTEGMLINLQDGHIDAYNFKLSSQYLTIESSEGGLISLRSEGTTEFIKLTTKKDKDNNFPLQIGSNFSVDWSGNIIAEGGNIAGWKLLNKSLTNDGTNYFIGFSNYAGHNNLIVFTGRERLDQSTGEIYTKDIPDKIYGPANVGLFPNRDNVIIVGVPEEDWLFTFDKSGAETNTLNKSRNFGTARFRVTNGGSVEAFNGRIGDIYIRPRVNEYTYPIDIVGLLTEIAGADVVAAYRANIILPKKE